MGDTIVFDKELHGLPAGKSVGSESVTGLCIRCYAAVTFKRLYRPASNLCGAV